MRIVSFGATVPKLPEMPAYRKGEQMYTADGDSLRNNTVEQFQLEQLHSIAESQAEQAKFQASMAESLKSIASTFIKATVGSSGAQHCAIRTCGARIT